MDPLIAEAHRLLQASLAEGTHRAYQGGVTSFNKFRASAGYQQSWPAPCHQVVAFIAALSLEGKAPATIKSYIAGLAYIHKINGWEDPTKLFIIQKLLEGSQRLNGRVDKRVPITFPVLVDILSMLDRACASSYETALFRGAFLLTFFGFLRVGEVTLKSRLTGSGRAILISDVFMDRDVLQVRIRYSKTDQLGKSTMIVIRRLPNNAHCPVAAIAYFLSMRPAAPGPLFIHLDQSPLTRFQFQSVLNRTLSYAGYSSGHYKSHSFRIGAATTAALCGFKSDDIKLLGHWKSNSYKLYIRPQVLFQA